MVHTAEHIFYAEEYHQHIPLSFIDKQSGKLHSKFTNGLNIQFGEKLLFIGTTKNGQLPFGIHLRADHVKQLLVLINEHSMFVWEADRQQIRCVTAPIIISLNKGAPFMNELPQIHRQLVLRSFPVLLSVLFELNEKTGLDIVVESFMWDYTQRSIPNTEVEQRARHLIEVVSSSDRHKVSPVLRYFIGRGKGLTPSGDDTLVGLLAIHKATNICSHTFITVLTEFIEHESLTTDVGKEYLRYAIKGNFSSSIVDIMQYIKEENTTMQAYHLRELLNMGHSSGVDTAFGMMVGMLALRLQY